MSFIISGKDVVGTYGKNIGVIKGTLSNDGKTIKGTWANFPTYSSPNDAGKFEITISTDGKSFTGKWKYGYEEDNK